MNQFGAVCIAFGFGLMVILCVLAWAVAWTIASIWAINMLGGTLEYNWQTVVAIMVIGHVLTSMFSSSTSKEQEK